MMVVHSNSSSRNAKPPNSLPPPHPQSPFLFFRKFCFLTICVIQVKVIAFIFLALGSYCSGHLPNFNLNSQVGGGSQTGASHQISQPSIAPVPNPNPPVLSTTPFQYANQNPRIAYWKLAIQSPDAFCTTVGIVCRTPIPSDSKIHGLYALDANIQILTPNIQRGEKLKSVDISGIEGLLNHEWPQLGRGSNLDFWDRQYNKHGRLTGLTEREYFELAIDMKADFDQLTGGLENLFASAHMKHRRLYKPLWFCNAVTAKTTVSPDLKCSKNIVSHEQLLEVHSCRTSTGNHVNCSPTRVCKTYGPCSTRLLYA